MTRHSTVPPLPPLARICSLSGPAEVFYKNWPTAVRAIANICNFIAAASDWCDGVTSAA